VREQIQAMLKDGILEGSHSACINPITLVVREGKAVGICLVARRINKQMVADRTKIMPMRELLKKNLWCQIYYESGPKQCFSTGTS
jgi:hypothetical protein